MIIYLLMVLHYFISLHSDRALRKKDDAIAARNSRERKDNIKTKHGANPPECWTDGDTIRSTLQPSNVAFLFQLKSPACLLPPTFKSLRQCLPHHPLNSTLQLLRILPVQADQSVPSREEAPEQVHAQPSILLAAERNPLAAARRAF